MSKNPSQKPTLYEIFRGMEQHIPNRRFLDQNTDAARVCDLHELRISSPAGNRFAELSQGIGCIGAIADLLSGLATEEDFFDGKDEVTPGERALGISPATHGALLNGIVVFSHLLESEVYALARSFERLESKEV